MHMARRILLSLAFLMPIEKRTPVMPSSRSSTPNIRMPSCETAYSSRTTSMRRTPRGSRSASTISDREADAGDAEFQVEHPEHPHAIVRDGVLVAHHFDAADAEGFEKRFHDLRSRSGRR